MITSSLRAKMLLSVGIIISVILGTSTFVHIQDSRQDYLDALGWRSEALAQDILNEIMDARNYGMNTLQELFGPLALRCIKLYELNKEKNVTHFAVIDSAGVIIAHNDRTLWNTQVTNARVLSYLQRHEQVTILDETIYRTFVPIFGNQNTYLGSIDIGISKRVVDEKIRQILFHSGGLFGLFLIMTFFSFSFLIHVLLTKPIKAIVGAGQRLAEGDLAQTFQTTKRKDEIARLETAFNRVITYLQNIAAVAAHIATGVLNGEVQVRSEQDVLGTAVHEMLRYLNHVAVVAERIAEGNLAETVQVRSAKDAFGKVIQAMTEGLRTLIVQIRISGERLASTKTKILSLAEHDIQIVEQVHHAAEDMLTIMRKMGTSVEEVAQNMGILSSSVEETSASMFQMTSSIAHIAVNTNNLTDKTHQTIKALKEALQSLEKVVENTDVSKRLSQDTIQDALKGQEAVEQVRKSMETIQQTVTTAVDTITRFEQRSQDIGTILEVIRDITEQTSLLALNASIIAAQAGAHGRGFAVVADEIKNLASGVANSTKDIAVIVRSLQQDTSHVVQTIYTGAEHVRQGMERTQQAQETLQKILQSAQQSSAVVTEIAETLHGQMTNSRNLAADMEQVNTMTDDITAATEEQEASTRQMNVAITHINAMASQIQGATTEQLEGVQHVFDSIQEVSGLIDQNLQSSQQIMTTTEELSSQADILMRSVDRFKLEA